MARWSLLLFGLFVSLSAISADLPHTKKIPVTTTYHGVKVTEDYRWLEDWSDPEVRAWSQAQNAYTRSILDHLSHVDQIRSEVTKIMKAKTVNYYDLQYVDGKLFAMKQQPPKQQPFIVCMDDINHPEKSTIVVDPNSIDPKGTTSIDFFRVSPDGRWIAVSLSEGGSEAGDIHLFSTKDGKEKDEIIPRVNTGTAGGDLAWSPDSNGFYYTRHPRGNERPAEDRNFYQQAYYHKLGTKTENDRYEIGKDFPRIAEIEFSVEPKTGTVLLTVQKGDGGQFAHYLRSPEGKWTQFSYFEDSIIQAAFGPDQDLYIISRENAPRGKILHTTIADPDLSKAKTIIPQGQDAIVTTFYRAPSSLLPTAHNLYLIYQTGGPSEIRIFGHDGSPKTAPKQLPVSTVGGMVSFGGDNILFMNTSYTQPPAFYSYSADTNQTVITKLATPSPVDFSDIVVKREFATSKDGTKIPVNIMMPESLKLDGKNPCIVYGYGGYGISLTPRFSAIQRVLFDQGFVYAIANLRGGSEYGEEWHTQGNLTNKQNVFDDFAAAVEYMIHEKYSSPAKLAIIGGSNGGLLMGATLTQHPNLMRAVVSYVGIYDMLRNELTPNGTFNIPEFGTVKNEEQFKALYAYSPYHHVKDGTAYPSVLFLTGENDPRVDPMHSRKMTARLQEATSSKNPILLRTSANSGHGIGTALNEKIEQTVDVYAFLFDQLGVNFKGD